MKMDKLFKSVVVLTLALSLWGMPVPISAQNSGNDVLYTTDADFDKGTLVSVNHNAPNNNQLQLDSPTKPFPFINVAASGRGTMVRTNTETGEIVGEYRTAPDGRGLNPSRTTVDLFGNVWTANRDEAGLIDGVLHGSAVKIGLIVGGTRVNGNGSYNPDGDYLAPPFGYNTCVDRNGDGFIRTSRGLGDILDWPDNTDGLGGADGIVQDAVDECILIYQRLPNAENPRHVSVDADNNVWVGGYPYAVRTFYKLDGNTGAFLDSFDARMIGCGGYGGLIDGNGILWSVGGALLRYDPVAHTGFCIQQYGYGLGIDTNGYIWMSLWDGGIVKIAPDGTVMPGFPKPTFPSSMTALTMAVGMEDLAAIPQDVPAGDASDSRSADHETGKLKLSPPEHASSWSWPVPNHIDKVPKDELQALNEPLAEDPSVTFQVAPVDDWVQSFSPWTPNATITLTIEEGGVVMYTDSQAADGNGNFNFNLWDRFDLKRGQVVTVSDGTHTKTHTVMNLFVDGVNVTTDTVSGRADVGADVNIWVHGNGGVTVTPDGSGNWTADFSGQTDLTYLSDGGSEQLDTDGDATCVWWASPRIQVAPDDNWVQSWNPWTPGTTIALTIEDGGVVVYSDSQVANADGNFQFNLWNDNFNLQRGQVVTVSDGTNTKTHTVLPLYVDRVNVNSDTLSGRGQSNTDVEIWVHGDGNLYVTTDSSGYWTADFSGQTDLTYMNDGGSRQFDDDGDATGVWWSSPRIQVAPEDEWVQSQRPWTPGSTITLTIKEGGAVVYSDSQVADAEGYFFFNLWDGNFDLQRGQEVIVSDGTNTKTHIVMPLYVDVIDVAADTISGRGDPNANVDVWVHGDGNVTTTPDGSGNWTADFSGMTDLTYANDGGSQQFDDDGDSTGVWWSSPRFWVAPDDNWVQSNTRWTPGATITLTIKNGGSVVYTASQPADSHGNFYFDLGGGSFDLQRGQEVTISDGTITKTHTVMPFYVDDVNVSDDTISGRADAGTSVDVWVHGDGNLLVTADGSGHWTADFSSQTDLTYLNDGGSAQYDDDGDGTGVWWSSPNIQVSPDENWVQQWNRWTPGTTVTLTVEEGGAIVFTDTLTTDTYGNFSFNVWGVDLDTGHVVTVSDGTTTKTHTVTDVNVTNIDMDADQIRGSANPGAAIRIWVNDFKNGSERRVIADSAGNWVADYSMDVDGQPAFDITEMTFISANEFDDDGDSTWRRAGALIQGSTGVAVTHSDNNVWVANRNSGTVTRLDNDGNVLKMVPTGQVPTGVAVDAAGKIWATNMNSDNVVRIDPNADTDGLGAVDMTVDLGPGASPYNYSDMTGAVVVGSTSPQGIWTVVQDSAMPGFEWGRILWNTEPQGNEPPGTAILVEARSADTEAGLGGQTFQLVANGSLFSMFGRFIEVRVTLKASPDGVSPVLSDIRIQPHIVYVNIDIKPGSYPNSINCKNKNEVIAVAILTTDDFDALTIDHTTVTFERASETHVNKKTGKPQRHMEDVDFDGDMDLVFHFRLGDTTLTCGSVAGTLTGRTYDGIPVRGMDSIRTVKVGDCGYTPDTAGLSCQDILNRCPGVQSGEKWVEPDGTNAILAYCSMDEERHGWTLIYNRNNAYFSPDHMYNELPAQGPDFSSNSTSWFIPIDATRWLWEVSVDSGASYRTLETSIPPEARATTHATVENAPISTVYQNTTGASGPFYFQTITFLDKCLYGCDSGQASWWGIVNVSQGTGDQENPGLGGHTDWCSMNSMLLPGDNYTWDDGDLEYYLSDWKNIGGDGIGGTNCNPYFPTTQYRYRFWAR